MHGKAVGEYKKGGSCGKSAGEKMLASKGKLYTNLAAAKYPHSQSKDGNGGK